MKTNILYYAIDGLIGRYGELKDNIILDCDIKITLKSKSKHDILSDLYYIIKDLQLLIEEDSSRKFVIIENNKRYLFGIIKTYNYSYYEVAGLIFNLLKFKNNA